MKKQTRNKLPRLQVETIRPLTNEALVQVQGGYSAGYCHTKECGTAHC